MRDVKNKSFGPGDPVFLDGLFFIDCSFDGCTLNYNGTAVKFKNCHFHDCTLIIGPNLGLAVEVLRFLGFDLTAVGASGNRTIN